MWNWRLIYCDFLAEKLIFATVQLYDIPWSREYQHTLLFRNSTFCQKVTAQSSSWVIWKSQHVLLNGVRSRIFTVKILGIKSTCSIQVNYCTYFVNKLSLELSKLDIISEIKMYYKLMLSKNVNNKKCPPLSMSILKYLPIFLSLPCKIDNPYCPS